MKGKVFMAAAGALALSASALAQNVAGRWENETAGRGGGGIAPVILTRVGNQNGPGRARGSARPVSFLTAV